MELSDFNFMNHPPKGGGIFEIELKSEWAGELCEKAT